jgi:CDP-diacylglycerol---serine O-phosphatidyltransferase
MTPRRDSLPFLYLVPNLVTILGMCAGLSAIRFAFEERYELSAALIIVAAIMDALDGALARKLNAASSFGAELDSFADFVSFGVAPSILVFGYAMDGPSAGFGWIFALVFAICACLRLARFNISRATPEGSAARHFVGVPAPAGAMLGLLPVYLGLAGWVDTTQYPLLTAIYLAGIGLLMVSRLPTPSLKGLRIARENAVWVMVGMAAFVGLLITRTWATMVLTDLIYLVVLAMLALKRLRAKA